MKDKELTDILLRLEARITQLENHYHTFSGQEHEKQLTSLPKVPSSGDSTQ